MGGRPQERTGLGSCGKTVFSEESHSCRGLVSGGRVGRTSPAEETLRAADRAERGRRVPSPAAMGEEG